MEHGKIAEKDKVKYGSRVQVRPGMYVEYTIYNEDGSSIDEPKILRLFLDGGIKDCIEKVMSVDLDKEATKEELQLIKRFNLGK